MYLKYFINFLLILLITIFQISFVSSFPSWFSYINIVLVILVFILILFDLNVVIPWIIVSGLIMDIFTFGFFGFYILSLSSTILIVNLLLKNFFTNRSMYSFLALIFFATVINFVITMLFSEIISLFSEKEIIVLNLGFFRFMYKQIIMNILGMAFLYYLTNFLSNSLRPVFLVTSNKK